MDEPLLQNPYKILNVPKDANLATIRSARRRLVLACHPDKVQDESAKKIQAEHFHQVQQAYEVLSDETQRQKYDNKVKLAELRAEMGAERGPPRRSESYQSPRFSGRSPIFEARGEPVYEERVPRSRVYEEDMFATKFAESRPSARKYDEMYAETQPSNQRRSSGRQQDDRRRMREVEEERERRERDARKAKEAAAREEKERRRAKDRKRDMEAKSSRKFNNTYMDTDSDSGVDDRRHSGKREATPPKRRFEDTRRKPDRDEPRRSTKREDLRRDRDYDEDSIEAKMTAAQDYMERSREFVEVEIEPRNRSSRKRADSNLDRSTPIPPPLPARPVDNRRRSSDRERSDKERSGRSGGESDRRDDRRRGGRDSRQPSPIRRDSGKKDKKFRDVEIVEAVSSGRKALPTHTSDPKGFKEKMFGSSSSRKDPHRSTTTYQTPLEPAFKHPGMKRAKTMPVSQMRRNDPVPLKLSHLKNAKGQGSSSDDSDTSDATNDTPEIKPRLTTRKFKVQADEAQSLRTVCLEPEEMFETPKSRRTSDRPNLPGRGSLTRAPPGRSMTYAVGEDRPSPRPSGASRAESSRATPPLKTSGFGKSNKLFSALDEDAEIQRFMHSSPRISSPKMSPVDIRYSNKPRRSSEDVDRDAFPGSLHKSHRKPSYQRGESVY